jgi:hypothetical protein
MLLNTPQNIYLLKNGYPLLVFHVGNGFKLTETKLRMVTTLFIILQ